MIISFRCDRDTCVPRIDFECPAGKHALLLSALQTAKPSEAINCKLCEMGRYSNTKGTSTTCLDCGVRRLLARVALHVLLLAHEPFLSHFFVFFAPLHLVTIQLGLHSPSEGGTACTRCPKNTKTGTRDGGMYIRRRLLFYLTSYDSIHHIFNV